MSTFLLVLPIRGFSSYRAGRASILNLYDLIIHVFNHTCLINFKSVRACHIVNYVKNWFLARNHCIQFFCELLLRLEKVYKKTEYNITISFYHSLLSCITNIF